MSTRPHHLGEAVSEFDRYQHEITVAYDALRDTANLLGARYISLSRSALGNPDQQHAWNEHALRVRDEVTGVDHNNLEAIEALAENFRRELRELDGNR